MSDDSPKVSVVAVQVAARATHGDGRTWLYGTFQCPHSARWFWAKHETKAAGFALAAGEPEFGYLSQGDALMAMARELLALGPDYHVEIEEPHRVSGRRRHG